MGRPLARGLLGGALAAWLGAGIGLAQPVAEKPVAEKPGAPAKPVAARTRATDLAPSDGSTIVAVVNGEVITQGDVVNRRRLFALSIGLPVTQEVLDRLTPQVTTQLITEKLRLQELQRRHIVVSDKEIADAIAEIEQRNNLPKGELRHRLMIAGVDPRTLIDQVRVQVGWGQVLRQALGAQARISDADVSAKLDLLKAETGQPEYMVSEIFIPVGDRAQAAGAHGFADTVITQLRAGAPFAIVAAEFSQGESALQGGDLGWVQATQVDPAVLRVLQEMPVGAVSNPIEVPGGISIVTLRAKQQIGNNPDTVVTIRQTFFRFATRLDPNNPTPQQRQQVDKAHHLTATAKSCDDMVAAAKAEGDAKGGDPGPIRLSAVAVAPLRKILADQPLQKPAEALIAEDGAAVVMVCARDQQNLGLPSKQEMTEQLFNERVSQTSRQLMRDLQRRALIDRRS